MFFVYVLLISTAVSFLLWGLGRRKVALSVALAPISIFVAGVAFQALTKDLDLGAGYGAGAEFVVALLYGGPVVLFLVSNGLLWTLGRSIPNDAGRSRVAVGLAGAVFVFTAGLYVVPKVTESVTRSANERIYGDLDEATTEDLIELVRRPPSIGSGGNQRLAIGELRDQGEDAVPAIIDALQGEYEKAKENPPRQSEGTAGLLTSLGRIGGPEAMAELRRWIDPDIDADCAVLAGNALAEAGDYESLPRLRALLESFVGDPSSYNGLYFAVGKMQETGLREGPGNRWDDLIVARYPREEVSLPALLGPLFYPGMRLEDWTDLQLEASPAWVIHMTSEDSLVDIVAHYMSVLPEGINFWCGVGGDYWRFNRLAHGSADGRRTSVTIRGEGPISLTFRTELTEEAVESEVSLEDVPVAWSSDAQSLAKRVAEFRDVAEAVEIDAVRDGIFPTARLICADFGAKSHTKYATNATYVTPGRYEDIRDYFERLLGSATGLGGPKAPIYRGQYKGKYELEVRLVSPEVNIPIRGNLFQVKLTPWR